MPEQLSDRMQEGCEWLVAIADRLGRGGGRERRLVELLVGVRLDEQATMRARLLSDLRDIWRDRETELGRRVRAIRSAALLPALKSIEEAPWAGYYTRGLEANDLASLLRRYDSGPKNVKVRGEVFKGYRRDDLFRAFERYLPDSDGSGGSAYLGDDT